MDPEQRLLVILEYLAVEVQILFLGTLVGMLGPQRLCLVDQFGTLSDLQLLGFFCCLGFCILALCFFLLLRLDLFEDFIIGKLFLFLDDLGLLGVRLGQIDLRRHEGTILLHYLTSLILITELQAILI